MRLLAILLLVSSFIAAGCASEKVSVYTFQKARVDQSIKGNEGYLMGQPPAGEQTQRSSKRTLIGVDIELPGTFAGSSSAKESAAEGPQTAPVQKAEENVEYTKEGEVWIK